MSKYPLNTDDGELTAGEQRRLIDELVVRRMLVVSDDHLATYWVAKQKHDQQERDRVKGQNNQSTARRPYPSYDPSELHELRAIITEDVRQRVLEMVHYPLDGEKQQSDLDTKAA